MIAVLVAKTMWGQAGCEDVSFRNFGNVTC